MDNYLKEILAFEYYGSILNNRPETVCFAGLAAVFANTDTSLHSSKKLPSNMCNVHKFRAQFKANDIVS